jgi:hypothetical protein|tara:strand:- start:2703 stop:2990 length:288 start_codon:yes stop_codon:yes gene_type:complete
MAIALTTLGADCEWSPFDVAMNMAKGDSGSGSVRTQHDMTSEEIEALEELYDAKIRMDVEVLVHNPWDRVSVESGWFTQRKLFREKQAEKENEQK